MVSEVLMTTCMLIPVSSKEVKWTVRDTSSKLGHALTLFCKVDNCTVHETKRWYGGPDDKVLMLNSGISNAKAKYSTSIVKNGFILTILNLTVKDLNVSYTCSCGLDLDNHILYIEDVYTVDNLNKSTNGTNYVPASDGSGIHLKIALPMVIFMLLFVVLLS